MAVLTGRSVFSGICRFVFAEGFFQTKPVNEVYIMAGATKSRGGQLVQLFCIRMNRTAGFAAFCVHTELAILVRYIF